MVWWMSGVVDVCVVDVVQSNQGLVMSLLVVIMIIIPIAIKIFIVITISIIIFIGQVFIGGAVLADVMKDKEEFWITKVLFFSLV